MRFLLLGVLLALPNDASLFAKESKVLVEAGEFVRIYDPSVGEDEPWYVNDHCFVFGPDEKWHLFGITHEEPANPKDEDNLAHATAGRLLQQPWDKQPFALTVAPESPWEETHLWAPHVVFHDGLYYMYYCAGGPAPALYKIHLATSPDLKVWTRHPKNPMAVDGYDGRDPFLLRHGDQWIMYYTATSEPEQGNHVVSYVTSDDLVTWSDHKFALVDPMKGTRGGPTESPFIVQRGERYYLFLSQRGGYDGTEVFVSDDPFHWTIEHKVGRIEAHAAEVVRDRNGDWYISRCGWGRGGVYLAPLIWNDGQEDPETNITPPNNG